MLVPSCQQNSCILLQKHCRQWRIDTYIKHLRTNPYYLSDFSAFEAVLAEDMESSIDEMRAELGEKLLVTVSEHG